MAEQDTNELQTTRTLFNTELKITVSGKVASGKTTLLNIIKDCLERDYVFRTMFAGCKIAIDEQTIPDEQPSIVEEKKEENDKV